MSDFLILSEKVEKWNKTEDKRIQGLDLVSAMIDYVKNNHTEMKQSYERYAQISLPINQKVSAKNTAINNKIKDDYRALIVNQITSYLLGNAVLYDFSKENYTNISAQKIKDNIKKYVKINNIDSQNTVLSNYMGACGVGYRLVYNRNNEDKAIILKPWNTLYFIDSENEVPIVGAYIYDVAYDGKAMQKVELYDVKNVYVYLVENGSATFLNDYIHTYNYLPIIRYINNDLIKSDFYMVEDLINAVDKNLSYFQDEIEYFANAYLVMTGCAIDDKEIEKARETGVFQIPTPEGKMEFIVKDIKIEVLEKLNEIYNKNIYNFASVVDFSDDSFSGASGSGESRRWRLMNLENKAKSKERYIYAGLLEEFKVIASRWNMIGIPLNYIDMDFVFSRNIPVDLSYYADFLSTTGNKISQQTALSQVPFIENPQDEIAMLEEEAKEEPNDVKAKI